jgi:hypothetical protein
MSEGLDRNAASSTGEGKNTHISCHPPLFMNHFQIDLLLHPSTSTFPVFFHGLLKGEALFPLQHFHCQNLHQLHCLKKCI